MTCIAIIPARGGSKRIPRKNIKDFCGKPIIAYSIEAALASNLFDEVMVSTDDEEIAEIAIQSGAVVPFMRSPENSNDFAVLNDVLKEVLECYRLRGKTFMYGSCLLPTAPFITVEKLTKGYEMLLREGFDSVRPVVKFSYPVQRAFKLLPGNKVEMLYPEFQFTRSQDLEPAYHDAGQFYWFRTDKMLSGTNKGALVVSEMEVQDIDTEEDWEIAEIKMRLLRSAKRS